MGVVYRSSEARERRYNRRLEKESNRLLSRRTYNHTLAINPFTNPKPFPAPVGTQYPARFPPPKLPETLPPLPTAISKATSFEPIEKTPASQFPAPQMPAPKIPPPPSRKESVDDPFSRAARVPVLPENTEWGESATTASSVILSQSKADQKARFEKLNSNIALLNSFQAAKASTPPNTVAGKVQLFENMSSSSGNSRGKRVTKTFATIDGKKPYLAWMKDWFFQIEPVTFHDSHRWFWVSSSSPQREAQFYFVQKSTISNGVSLEISETACNHSKEVSLSGGTAFNSRRESPYGQCLFSREFKLNFSSAIDRNVRKTFFSLNPIRVVYLRQFFVIVFGNWEVQVLRVTPTKYCTVRTMFAENWSMLCSGKVTVRVFESTI